VRRAPYGDGDRQPPRCEKTLIVDAEQPVVQEELKVRYEVSLWYANE
jgi:hypothetical protein